MLSIPALNREAPQQRPRRNKYLGVGNRQFGALLVLLASGWLVIAAYAVHPLFPFNTVRLPYASTINAPFFLPEGWAFFTRSPREPRMLLFVRRENDWRTGFLGPHSRLQNVLGLNRASRGQGVELGMVRTLLEGRKWARCRGLIPECLEALSSGATFVNRYPRPTICGTVGIAMQPPTPWAWARPPRKVNMPSAVYRLTVTC